MRALLAIIAIAAVLGAGGLALWLVGIRRAFEAAGLPTPDSARVKIETADDKARKANNDHLEEVRNASHEDRLRDARARIRGVRGE